METNNRIYLFVLVLTVAFGSYLRLHNLGLSSFWVDELDFVEAAKSRIRVGEPLLASGYAYPRTPLLTYSLVASYKVLGVSEFSSRLPSAIFGILSIPLIYYIGRKWFDVRTGLFAAVFLTCAPFEVGWSRACRMYALLQLLFLLGMYLFYRGFEAAREGSNEKVQRPASATGWLRTLIRNWQINPPLLFTGGFFLFLSYTSHQNAGLFLFSFIVFVVLMGLHAFVRARSNTRSATFPSWREFGMGQKYVLLAVVVIPFLLGATTLPSVRDFVTYAMGYLPKWAEVASAQNRCRILEFIFTPAHFPVYVLFPAGAILVLWRWHKPGIYSLVNLVVPVLMFSFIFHYRKNDYVYHVYPVLFLLAGVALSELIRLSSTGLKRLLKRTGFLEPGLVMACLLLLPLTPGFRFAQKIPRLPDGHFNGAIYHNEWKEAAAFLAEKVGEQDLLMSTLPLSVQYYLGRADYNLNWSNGDLAHENNIVAQDGRFIDLYSGTDIIEEIEQVRRLMRERPGWLLVDSYRFENDVYVPPEVRTFVKENMALVYKTKRKTVIIYRWETPEPASGTN